MVARLDVFGRVEFRDDLQRLDQRPKQLLLRYRGQDVVLIELQGIFYLFGFLPLLLLGRCGLLEGRKAIVETIIWAFVDL